MSAAYHPPLGPTERLWTDASLLVAVKPAGLLSVPGKTEALADCLLARLQGEDPDVRLVHRLDRDTSGVMVFARSAHAQRHLGLQFERRHLEKRYVARVAGHPDADAGQIDLPLTADWPNRPRQMVCHANGRPARTRWRVLSRDQDGSARLALEPETGRSHQLRVHLAEIGHPILGDPLYGPAEDANARRLMLHAECLRLRHPDGGAWVTFEAVAPF
ncbi:MAG: RluA family pseudouridine synthase [Pseudomonadota bacterium]